MARAPKETSSEPATNKIAEARARNLDLPRQQIQKDYGKGAILRMGEDHKHDVSVIPTGNLLIDQALAPAVSPAVVSWKCMVRNPPVRRH